MLNKMILYFQRRRKHSYTDLWELLYGDDDQSKGYVREYEFSIEVANVWKNLYEKCQKKLKT
jgi:hypothetical protein